LSPTGNWREDKIPSLAFSSELRFIVETVAVLKVHAMLPNVTVPDR